MSKSERTIYHSVMTEGESVEDLVNEDPVSLYRKYYDCK